MQIQHSPIYKAIKGRATHRSNPIKPNPQYNAVRAAVLTTPSPGLPSPSLFPPDAAAAALALANKLVVATFKNANKYKLPSIKVVAGPSAANCVAPPSDVAERPTKEVSTRDNNGPEIQRAKQGT
jgi:hypothetical protein